LLLGKVVYELCGTGLVGKVVQEDPGMYKWFKESTHQRRLARTWSRRGRSRCM